MKVGDTPTLRIRLATEGETLDLSGWECRLLVRRRGNATLVINEVVEGEADDTGGWVVEYTLGATELAQGFYEGEVQATEGDTVLTFPDEGFLTFSVNEDLGPPAD